ncbi:hypothetical protein LF65_02286 [Clostridium beijerinckii]|uniref:Uncharacterized protein n=1 Tax=Clostridium beijerinckii TaxID=1520 RepID=A0A0B5QLJ9_CLOBE|nr:hypothetical protein [Clostridium beijerinckii]AJG98872.1 hypothetical protein LF65_02286 [Clostridium beijerinckii]
MDIEELRVKLVASAEGFETVISKIKQQLTGLNKEVDRINEKIAGKRSNNKDNNITPKIDSNDLEKQLDNLTSKVSSKTDEMVRKIESKTQGLMGKLAAQADKLADAIGRGVGSIRIPVTRSSGEAAPKTSDARRTSSPRAPPKTATINTEELKANISNVEVTLDNVNARIELQKAKLAELREAYSMAFNPNTKNKIQDQMLKTEALINNLISRSNKLGFTLADLDVKLASVGGGTSETASKINNSSNATSRLESVSKKLKSVFDSINNSTAKLSGKLNTFSGVAKKVGSNISNVASKTKGLFSGLKNLGSSAENCNKKFENMNHGLNNVMRQFFTWMVILPMLMKGLSEMASFLGSALMTNNQFTTSLNQIKSNLYAAFMPIYNAILPALNSLMSALGTATAYIASFFSQLAGTTYDASFKAAQNLQSSIGAYNQQEKAAKKAANALGTAGNAAKKAGSMAKNGLASFDEINKLSEKTPTSAGSGVVTPITPMANMAPIEAVTAEWVKKFKDIMSKIFDPMKEAWANEGKATMDALKYALGSIWDLAKDIGKTFLDIWGNGTGVKVCTDILKLLQTIFNIIGDIAKAFKTAWDNGDLGKQVIQALFDAFDSILRLLTTIGQVFRDVWNSGIGVEICTNILKILKNIFTIIGQVADSFNKAFQSDVGKKLVEDILDLLNGCLRSIKDITESFSKAWESNGDTICSAILLILDNIVGIISDIANKWANAWESNDAGNTLMDSLLSTLGKILTTIGDIGQGIRESLGKVSDEIFPTVIQFATDVSNGLGNLADGFKFIWDNGGKHLFDGISQLIAKVAELILKISGNAFSDFSNIFKDLAPIIGKVADVLGYLLDGLGYLIDKVSQNKALVEGLAIAFGAWVTVMTGMKLSSLITDSVTALNTKLGNLKDKFFSFGKSEKDAAKSGQSAMDKNTKAVKEKGTALEKAAAKIKAFDAEAATMERGALATEKNTKSVLQKGLALEKSAAKIKGFETEALTMEKGALATEKSTKSILEKGMVLEGTTTKVTTLGEKIKSLGEKIKSFPNIFKNFASKIASLPIISTIAETAMSAFGIALGALTSPVGIAVIAIGGLIAAGVALYENWDTVKEYLTPIWKGICDTAKDAWNGLENFFSQWGLDVLALFTAGPLGVMAVEIAKHWDEIYAKTTETWNRVSAWLGINWGEISQSASTKFGEVKTYIGQKWDEAKTDAETKWENIKTTLSSKWQLITTASNKTWDDIKDYVSKKWDAVNKDASDDWESIKTTLSKKWDTITKTSSDTWDNIKKYINDKWTEINTDAPGLWDQIKTTLAGKWNEIATTSQGVWNGIVTFLNTTFSGSWRDAWNGLKDIVGEAFSGLEGMVKKPINAIIGFVNKLIDALNSIKIDIPDWMPGKYAGKSFSMGLQHVPALATGGIIDSPTLAMVGEAGKEAVMPLERNTGWIDDLAGKIAGKIGGNNSSGSTQNSSGDVIFMLDSDVIGKIAIDQLRKAQRQGKITVIPI